MNIVGMIADTANRWFARVCGWRKVRLRGKGPIWLSKTA